MPDNTAETAKKLRSPLILSYYRQNLWLPMTVTTWRE